MEGALVGNTEGSALKTFVQIFLTKIQKTVAIMLEVTPFIIGDVFFFKMYFFIFSLCPVDRSCFQNRKKNVCSL